MPCDAVLCHVVLCCADFEKLMLYHMNNTARKALDLYNDTEKVCQHNLQQFLLRWPRFCWVGDVGYKSMFIRLFQSRSGASS